MKNIKKLLSVILSILMLASTVSTSIAAAWENTIELTQQSTVESSFAYNNDITGQSCCPAVVGDINNDGMIDVQDYQVLVNTILAGDHEQLETSSYDDLIRYDLNSDGSLDALDAHLMQLLINGFATADVYTVGDYDCNGIAFEEADLIAIKHAVYNPYKLSTAEKYASDINGDGKVSEEDLTELTALYGGISDTECKDNAKIYYSWKNNYTTCTATSQCTICNKHIAAETIATTSETLSELTCTEDGKVKYTATFSDELFGAKSKEVVTKTEGHNWGKWKTETPASAVSAGKEKRICSVCMTEEDSVTDKLNLDKRIVAYYTVVDGMVINLVNGQKWKMLL